MGRECAICNEDYDEKERCPRSLPCSHTLCSQCIGNLISRNMKKCPYCSRNFNAGSVRDIGINTEFLEVLKLLNEAEVKSNTSYQMSTSSSGLMEELKEETQSIANELLIDCQKADQEIESLLQSSNQLIDVFSNAEEVLNNTLTNVNEMLSQNVNRVTYLKENRKRLESQKVVIKEKRNQIMASKTKAASVKTFTQAGVVADEVGCMKTDLQKTLFRFMEQVSKEEKTHLKLKKVAETTNESIVQLEKIVASAAKEDSSNFVPVVKNRTIPKSNLPHQVTIEWVVSRGEDVLDLVRQRKVFVSLDIEGRRRLAQLSLDENNKMLLHCLREQIPPHDASILKHPDVMNLFTDSSSKRIFLNFGTDEKSLGRIYISLKPDLKRSKNFWVLCTGEMGPSYLNSNISQVRNKGYDDEEIICGDYDGIGGKALIPGTGRERRGRLRQLLAGSVYGLYRNDNQEAKFMINMRDNNGYIYDTIFGKVESNYLHILEEAISQYENISEVKITDCGIVIPI